MGGYVVLALSMLVVLAVLSVIIHSGYDDHIDDPTYGNEYID